MGTDRVFVQMSRDAWGALTDVVADCDFDAGRVRQSYGPDAAAFADTECCVDLTRPMVTVWLTVAEARGALTLVTPAQVATRASLTPSRRRSAFYVAATERQIVELDAARVALSEATA